MARIFHTVKTWYERYEQKISSISLVGGFVLDAIFLTRVDQPFENVMILLHLGAAAAGILFLNALENNVIKTKISESVYSGLHFWSLIVIQFMFGGLLSKYLVFYYRSASLATSWPFLLFLAIAFGMNERMRGHYARLDFQLSFLFLSIYAYAIYFLPVVAGRIGDDIFVIAGLASLAATALFITLLARITRERFRKGRRLLYTSIGTLFVLINVLYFTNILPPLPVSLKSAGIYYSVDRAGADYTVTGRLRIVLDYFRIYQPIDLMKGQPVYAFTSVFSPAAFHMKFVHEWQRYDEAEDRWITTTIIPLSTAGGREEGFRTYSLKTSLSAGKWRVNVKTADGKTLGRIRFRINMVESTPMLEIKTIS